MLKWKGDCPTAPSTEVTIEIKPGAFPANTFLPRLNQFGYKVPGAQLLRGRGCPDLTGTFETAPIAHKCWVGSEPFV